MQFKKISLDDIPLINEYLTYQPYYTCDFTILGLYMWVNHFNYEYTIENDTLFIRENTDAGIKYFVPVSKTQSVIENIRFLINNSDLNSDRIIMSTVPEILINDIEKNFESKSVSSRDWADYIYNAPDLLFLTGKKYSKKRNLIHQFLNSYKYKVTPINSGNINELINFVRNINGSEELSRFANYENNETVEVLKHYNKFTDLFGFVYYVDKKIIGFSICECRNNTCFIQIEKALKEYKGSYQFIFWKTINEIYNEQQFQYVNREEDVGDIALRKAKMSYYPFKLIHKYEVTIRIENN